jgi:hypothetical protein
LDQAELFASKDSTDADAKMSMASNAEETQAKKPRRHYADAFAKDNSAFPLFIVWNVLEDIEFDQEDHAKKKGSGSNSSYPQPASAASSSWQTPVRANAFQQASGSQGADAWAEDKKNAKPSVASTHTIMPCRPSNTMHCKLPFNWMNNGGQP